MNELREKIFNEVMNVEFKNAGVFPPQKKVDNPNTDKTKYCKFYRENRHNIESCMNLKEVIKELVS